MRRAIAIVLTDDERSTLTGLARNCTAAAWLMTRARTVLAAAGGTRKQAIAAMLGVAEARYGCGADASRSRAWPGSSTNGRTGDGGRLRHRHQEWPKFLKRIDAETSAELDLRMIVDNYRTHKHPRVKAWLACHPRFHLHFIPMANSWLNLVERWFREIATKRIRRASFLSVGHLEKATNDSIAEHNKAPRAWSGPRASMTSCPKSSAHETLNTNRNQ